MTYLLRNVTDILDWHEFNSEEDARTWARDNISSSDYSNWMVIDPEGMDWCLR